MLGKVGGSDIVSPLDRPRIGLQDSGQELQEGRFSGPVRPYEGNLILPEQRQVDSGVNLHRAIRLMHPFQVRHATAAADGLGKEKRIVLLRVPRASMRSIFSRAFTRLCTCLAFVALYRKRSMNRSVCSTLRL